MSPTYPNLKVRATALAGDTAHFVITASDVASRPVGQTFIVRLQSPGMVIVSGTVPGPWCNATNFQQGVCGA
jgi:hypothetical protein